MSRAARSVRAEPANAFLAVVGARTSCLMIALVVVVAAAIALVRNLERAPALVLTQACADEPPPAEPPVPAPAGPPSPEIVPGLHDRVLVSVPAGGVDLPVDQLVRDVALRLQVPVAIDDSLRNRRVRLFPAAELRFATLAEILRFHGIELVLQDVGDGDRVLLALPVTAVGERLGWRPPRIVVVVGDDAPAQPAAPPAAPPSGTP